MPSAAMLNFHEFLLQATRASCFVTSMLVAKLVGLWNSVCVQIDLVTG